MITLVSTLLCLVFFSILIRFLHKVWWTPIYIQRFMKSQGIKGPSYKFLHGSTKEMIDLKNKANISPEELSHDIFSITQPDIYSCIKLYGKNFLMWHGHEPRLIVNEPELIKDVLSNKNGVFAQFKIYRPVKKLFGDGLATTAEGEKWSKLRRLANHAFHGDSFKEMVPAMIESVETMLERWRHHEGKEIEVYEEFRLLTSEVISKTAFGSSYFEGENIFEMMEKLFIAIFTHDFKVHLPIIEKFYKSRKDIETDELERSLRKSIVEMITKREEKVKTGEAESFGSDFLGKLMNHLHHSDEKNRISLDVVIDECKTFYFAGHETTTTTLAWCILLLSIHTDWQQKARNEILELYGQEKPNPESIAKLKILNMIVHESFRLYGPVTTIARTVKRRVKLGNLTLPPNINVFIQPLALNQSNEIWGQDAHLFNPERFSEGVPKAPNNVTVFLPFGFGPRVCVGMTYANMEIKMAVTMILQRYKISLSPSYVHSPTEIFLIRPKHGIQVVLNRI